jgi:hypothetical protein
MDPAFFPVFLLLTILPSNSSNRFFYLKANMPFSNINTMSDNGNNANTANPDILLPFSAPSGLVSAYVGWTNKAPTKVQTAPVTTAPVETIKNDTFLPYSAPSAAIGWFTS